MQTRRYHLVAFLAPGSVEAEVGAVQGRLFAEHGLASAQALPPLIPVRFVAAEAATPHLLTQVARSAPGPCSFRTMRHGWESGCLYLLVDSTGAWESARQAAAATAATAATAAAESGARDSGPFACMEGFFLGCPEASAEQRERITVAAIDLRFTSCTVALMRIDCLDDRQSWWRQLYWEILAERPLRVRRQG